MDVDGSIKRACEESIINSNGALGLLLFNAVLQEPK